MALLPAVGLPEGDQHPEHRHESDVDQRSGRDAPEGGARALRSVDIGDTTKRPQHDLVGGSAHLPAGQRMAELVHQDDQEEREVFQHLPGWRRIRIAAHRYLIDRDEKPGPMQIHIDAFEAKNME